MKQRIHYKNFRGELGNSERNNRHPRDTRRYTGPRLSLYNHFLQIGNIPASYLKMNSFEPNHEIAAEKKSVHQRNLQEGKSVKVEYSIEDTGIEFERKLPYLTNLDIQDPCEWLEEFKETRKLCRWNETAAVKILYSLLNRELQRSVKPATTIEEASKIILSIAYPISRLSDLYKEARRLRQNSYIFIRDYAIAVESITKRIAACKNLKAEDVQDRCEETFLLGLSPRTHYELSRINIDTKEEIVRHIVKAEETILSIGKLRSHPNEIMSERMRSLSIEEENIRPPTNRSFRKQNYYAKPENNSYKNSHTRTNTWFDKNKSKHDDTQTLAILEPKGGTQLIELPAEIKNHQTTCVIDSGSAYNFINEAEVERIGLSKKETKGRVVQAANGENIEINTETECWVKFNSLSTTEFKVSFMIMKNLSCPVVLGLPFLIENNCSLKFPERIITIEGREIEMSTLEKTFAEPDQIVVDKTKILKIEKKETPDLEIKRRIQERITQAKRENPEQGLLKGEFHRIRLRKEEVVTSKPYSVPAKLKDELFRELNRLKETGIISEKTSEYASPCFPILKRNGSLRLIIDYRKLNKLTIKENTSIPSLKEQLSDLKDARFFSSLDLNAGYYQLEIHPNDRRYTGFVVGERQFVFNRMAFGLTNAPRTFQRVLGSILRDIPNTKVYLDDILIYNDTLESHFKTLCFVLDKLKEKNLSINFSKCSFCQSELKYLGHIVSAQGIKADDSRVNSLRFQTPKSRRETMKLLGTINWFRPFLPGLSGKLLKIYDKLKKGSVFKWNLEDSKVVNSLCDEIKLATVLHHPDYNDVFVLETDASDHSLGAVLSQNSKPIGYYSYKLTPVESRYTTMEKEGLSVVKSLNFFKDIIFNSKIIIKCDNRNVIFMKENLNSRVQRWKLLLEEFDYKIEFLNGYENKLADHVSRCLITTKKEHKPIIDFQRILVEQTKTKEKGLLKVTTKFGNALFDKDKRLWIPDSIKKETLKGFHTRMGHAGVSRMYLTLKDFFFIKGFEKTAMKFAKSATVAKQKRT